MQLQGFNRGVTRLFTMLQQDCGKVVTSFDEVVPTLCGNVAHNLETRWLIISEMKIEYHNEYWPLFVRLHKPSNVVDEVGKLYYSIVHKDINVDFYWYVSYH